jgi:hypothetical protein
MKWWALLNKIITLQVPQNVGNLSSYGTISFSRRTLLYVTVGLSVPKHQSLLV